MSAMLSAKKLKIASPKPRLDSLHKIHGEHLDWTLYDDQWSKFHDYMTKPFNPDRDGVAYKPEGGNLNKVDFATRSCLINLAVNHGWEGPLSFEWFLEAADDQHFDAVYTSYAEYLHSDRDNKLGYIGKQLGDLQHALLWSSKQRWSWGYMSADDTNHIMSKIQALRLQYSAAGSKRSKLERTSKPVEDGLDLATCVRRTNELMDELLERVGDKPFTDITDEDKVAVVECTMLKLATRGGRGVDLHAVWLAFDHDWTLQWLEDHNTGTDDHKFLLRREDNWELIIYSKGHWINDSLEDATPLLDLYCKCFPHLKYGDVLFNPTFHGVRPSKAEVRDHFPIATKFDEVFQTVAHRRWGVPIRPYALRRYNCTNLHRAHEASDEVRRSHCALMGTGLPNIDGGAYDDRSDLEKSFLASMVQRFQFDPLYNPTVHNRILPALGTRGGVEMSVARLVRQEHGGTELFALFTEVDGGYFELSDRLVRTNMAQGFPSAKLVSDASSHRQRWRARDAAIRAAEGVLTSEHINRHQLAVESMVQPSGAPLQPKDMVYVSKHCAIGEVIDIDASASILKVRVATELMDASRVNSMETFYRFMPNSTVEHMDQSEVMFPIDLTFDGKKGDFILRKSLAMDTV